MLPSHLYLSYTIVQYFGFMCILVIFLTIYEVKSIDSLCFVFVGFKIEETVERGRRWQRGRY